VSGNPVVRGSNWVHSRCRKNIILGMFQCPAPIINLPPSSPNHEWLKILVTGFLGFVLGLVAEPIKAWSQRRNEERRIHRAFVYEVGVLFVARAAVKHGLVSEENFWTNIDTPAFDKSWEKNREYFYKDFNFVAKAYQLRMVGMLKQGVADGKINRADASLKLDGVIAELMKTPAASRWKRFKNLFRSKPETQTAPLPVEISCPPDSGSLDGQ